MTDRGILTRGIKARRLDSLSLGFGYVSLQAFILTLKFDELSGHLLVKPPLASPAFLRLYANLVLILWCTGPLWSQEQYLPELVTDDLDPQFGSVRWHCPNCFTDRAIDYSRHLQVFTTEPGKKSGIPAVLGAYRLQDDQLVFTPRFPFLSGRTYWVQYSLASEQKSTSQFLAIEIPELHPLQAPAVTAIYPSTDRWPANQLKFYIYFDQPMRIGQLTDALHLYHADGQRVNAPFLDMAQELWDEEQKRLTVWFDPGRIKSHLIPQRRMGPPLQPGGTYRLILKKSWTAANGLPLEDDVVKVFRTGEKDQKRPDPEDWQLSIPPSATRAPLEVHFPEPLDVALLLNGLGVIAPDGRVLEGEISLGKEEKSWSWTPAKPWPTGKFILRISTDVEDLAGNNLSRLFDTPVGKTEVPASTTPFVDRIFRIE